ncbi:MAG: glycine cleavage system aminomethyltransferase GcvT [Wenzhouxiangellaceae bacterium]
MSEARKTPLYDAHLAAGGQMTEFAGWLLPTRYTELMTEHHAVRRHAGMFDVSHMCIVDITGAEAAAFLRRLLANNIDKLEAPGKALYSCMLNEQGGILDDLIVYWLEADYYRLVVNAATAAKDLHWLQQQSQHFAAGKLQISQRSELALIALQGPEAEAQLLHQLPSLGAQIKALKPFSVLRDDHYCIARTGYTGEDGFEIMLDAAAATTFWQSLLDAGVTPCGLGARDTLRLEAGMSLYGQDMDESVTPLQCGLGWTVAWEPSERAFNGRAALQKQRDDGVAEKVVGLVLDQRNVLRSGYQVFSADDELLGVLTSGTFSPTICKPIGMARVSKDIGTQAMVEIRGRKIPARVVKPVFVRRGQIMPGIET